jgi:hypothetical protein
VADSEGLEACVLTWMGRDERAVRGRRTEPILVLTALAGVTSLSARCRKLARANPPLVLAAVRPFCV